MEDPIVASRLDLAPLVEIARTSQRREDAAEEICTYAISELGLAAASISLVNRDKPEPRLESVAAVGQHSTFIRDMSAPLDELAHASKTALGGEPIFVGNPHGMGVEPEKTSGVGRWRNGFGAHAYAVLALTVRENTIGVLSLEWPEPHPFADSDRRELQVFADTVALVVFPMAGPVPDANAAEAIRPEAETADIAAFESDCRGLILPVDLASPLRDEPCARVWTGVMQARPATDSTPFAEIMTAPDHGVVVAAGTVFAGSSSATHDVFVAGREVLRAAATRGCTPQEISALLSGCMASQSSGAWASLAVAAFHPATGAIELACDGAVAVLALRREGRLDRIAASPADPCGGRNRILLALPGDRIALLSGHVAALADHTHFAGVRRALTGTPVPDGQRVCRLLMSQVRNGGMATGVAVLEMAGAPSPAME